MSRRLVLQDFLPYLLNRAGMRIGLVFSRDVEPYGVTLPMWRVLIELWHKGDHRLGELAERTTIDLSTLSRLIVSMQRKRLVVRRRSGLDRRALSLALTEKGLELVEKVIPYALYYEQVAMRGLSESEIAQLKRSLRTIFENLEEASRQKAIATAPAKTGVRRGRRAKSQVTSDRDSA